MIARRFRALGWVAGISSAATGLYLISLQVAAERAKLEDVDRRIAATHRQMRQLQTELGTRASMRQLERWNDDVLALAAPRAEQYLHGEAQLASLSSDMAEPKGGLTAPHVVLVAARPVAAPGIAAPPLPIPRAVKAIVPVDAPRMTTTGLQHAAYVAPSGDRVAMTSRVVIDRRTLGDLLRAADREKRASELRKRP